ncbi:MAG: hypothetical protein VR65_16710 [Desulfobulbaceae bacterium BRH_c16a]|nr:MAG: hypothetical protein VR65_16710 [Desulfobulbaceae bacterium BRH_c16a]
MRNTLNILSTLLRIGQSLWLENISREQLQSGSLIQYIKEGSITGASVSPAACSRSLRSSEVYDNAIRKKLAEGLFGEPLAQELIMEDARHAADLLRPVFDRTDGVDGWVALTIFPLSTNDTAAITAAISNIHAKARRPNILITIPGLPDWLEAIEEVIYSGVPVSIAFLVSCGQFLSAAQACLRGIERRVAAGLKPAGTSFASISISRLVEALSAELSNDPFLPSGIAIARRIYKASRDLHNSQEWERAYNAGSRPLRLVWTMDTNYQCKQFGASLIKDLVAPLTVAAIPENTLKSIIGCNFLGTPLPADGGDCEELLSRYSQLGIDLDTFAVRLQNEEAASLISSWIELLDAVACKSALVTKC